jgi:hypothetical protein
MGTSFKKVFGHLTKETGRTNKTNSPTTLPFFPKTLLQFILFMTKNFKQTDGHPLYQSLPFSQECNFLLCLLSGSMTNHEYCAISINLTGPVTCDRPAEILVLATSQSCCDMPKFLGNFRQFSATGDEKISISVT